MLIPTLSLLSHPQRPRPIRHLQLPEKTLHPLRPHIMCQARIGSIPMSAQGYLALPISRVSLGKKRRMWLGRTLGTRRVGGTGSALASMGMVARRRTKSIVMMLMKSLAMEDTEPISNQLLSTLPLVVVWEVESFPPSSHYMITKTHLSQL